MIHPESIEAAHNFFKKLINDFIDYRRINLTEYDKADALMNVLYVMTNSIRRDFFKIKLPYKEIDADDIIGMMNFAEDAPLDDRSLIYKKIGDVSLFFGGLIPSPLDTNYEILEYVDIDGEKRRYVVPFKMVFDRIKQEHKIKPDREFYFTFGRMGYYNAAKFTADSSKKEHYRICGDNFDTMLDAVTYISTRIDI